MVIGSVLETNAIISYFLKGPTWVETSIRAHYDGDGDGHIHKEKIKLILL